MSLENKNVVMSNNVAQGRYSFSKEEQNFIYSVISQISKNDEDFKEYEVSISQLEELAMSKKKHIRFKSFAKSLVSKVITIRDEKAKTTTVAPWFSSVTYTDGAATIKASFDPKLKPVLLQLKTEFVQAKLPVLLSFKSKYTSRLYMYLKSIYDLATSKVERSEVPKDISVEHLMKQFELPNSYKQYSNFKDKFLLVSLKEINHKTDFNIAYTEIKTVRKITSIRFVISLKKEMEVNKSKTFTLEQEKEDWQKYDVIPGFDMAEPMDIFIRMKPVHQEIIREDCKLTKNKIEEAIGDFGIELVEMVCYIIENKYEKITDPQNFFWWKLRDLATNKQ